MTEPFWRTTRLQDMTETQWESLCDGCAKCCLLKLEDEDSGEIAYTRLHCRLLDEKTCQCSDYANRKARVPDCIKLTPDRIEQTKWMPRTCAYRLVNEGHDLPDWHHLVCGDRDRIHREGHSILGRTWSEDAVLEEDQIDFVVDWEGNAP